MTEKIILTLTKHPLWGYILQPVLVEENEYGKMAILEYADSQSSGFYQLDDFSKEIILLSEKMSDTTLMECFSKEKEKTIAAFHKKVKQETIKISILPYIEDIQKQILIKLTKTKLSFYFRENVKIRNLYETNKVIVPNDYSKAIFNFIKEEKDSSMLYSIHVIWQDEALDLFSQTYIPLCSEPAALVVNNKLLFFDDIDIKKLIPFFSRREIEIPISYENNYIKTFIISCMENHEVITKGIDVREITPHKKVKLSLDTDPNNMPVINLTFAYENMEYQLDKTPDKIVQAIEKEGETALVWFNSDKKWENKQIESLLKNGMEKTASNYFSLKKNKSELIAVKQNKNLIDWINQHSNVMKKFEFIQKFPDNN